jgi:hypothetical protein
MEDNDARSEEGVDSLGRKLPSEEVLRARSEQMKAMNARRAEERKQGAGAEAQPVSEDDDRLTNREVVQLVWGRLEAKALPDGTPGRVRSLWEWARKNKPEFLAKYVPILMRSEKEEVAGGAVEWDGEGPCPTCKRKPEPPDLGAERAMKIAEKWLRGRQAQQQEA